jgi:hypothetical protein
MRAGLRLRILLLAAGLTISPVAALAQETPPATTNTPATDAVGPRDLQNFSLQGTITRPVEQPAPAPESAAPPASRNQARTTPPASEPRRTTAAPVRPANAGGTQPPALRPGASALPAARVERAPEPIRQTTPASSVTVALPSLSNGSARSTAGAPASGLANEPDVGAGTLAPEHMLLLWPWLLAAIALGAGGAFLFWRNRSREAFADGPQFEAFSAPEPAPAPVPPARPAPPRRVEPSIPGIVTTRLRPWIEIGFHPIRFVVEEEQVAIEFDLELLNSGSVAAQAVLLEATLLNASANQDQELGAFFANPVGEGERIVVIQPLKRITVRSQVAVGREHVQVFELGGRRVCVPLIAMNALYRWSGGEGQTSVSYLLGRDIKGEKMAPFRLDLGPRLFRGVGARALPSGLRA